MASSHELTAINHIFKKKWDIYYLNEARIVLEIITEIVNIHDWIMIAALRIG
jgi:hypothetical protein